MANRALLLFRRSKLFDFPKLQGNLFLLQINSLNFSTTLPEKELKHFFKSKKKVETEKPITQQPITDSKCIVTKQDPTDSAEYFKMRSQVVEELKAAGKNPYLNKFNVSISLEDFVDRYKKLDIGQILKDVNVSVVGRILTKREFGSNLVFYDLVGEKAEIQVMADANHYPNKKEFCEINNRMRRGDIIGCSGHPCKTERGELSIVPTHMEILAPSLQMLPHPYYGLKDKETRFRKRFLDFIFNDSTYQRLILRAKVNKFIRSFLDQRGFIEVETSMMHTKPGGATAKPFMTHHNHLNMDLYLRIAPELKLKETLIGRPDRVYEISRNFRNEGIDSTHNPEFTTCEMYEAYKDYNDFMKMIENLFSEMVNDICKSNKIIYKPDGFEGKELEIDFALPFKKYPLLPSLQEAMGEELPKPCEYHLPEANKRLSYLCSKYNIECAAPRTSKRLLDKLIGHFLEKKLINPTFLYDYPEIMSPLAKCHRSISGLTERWELFIAKSEIVNAYSEENDPVVLRQRFKQQALDRFAGDNEAQLIDEDFCEAVEHGLKPCAGAGIGIDRLLMILSNTWNIKEVLSFPIIKPVANTQQNNEEQPSPKKFL